MYNEPWRQGVLLDTPQTRKLPESVKDHWAHEEKIRVFSNFHSSDFGESRKPVCMCNREEDARRIALCVNACAGITNEALEKGVVQASVEYLRTEKTFVKSKEEFMFDYVKVWEKKP